MNESNSRRGDSIRFCQSVGHFLIQKREMNGKMKEEKSSSPEEDEDDAERARKQGIGVTPVVLMQNDSKDHDEAATSIMFQYGAYYELPMR
ncbi:hypothetical protein CAEBREN_12064 [Caenorhabditis brenneri]|uniref:Uncharacterized protein n=1 Tax=Caenorhabditis brenneri TaxID=135651 RepID=G0NPV3_CAEBE|nr:hypothetical protein CAEBREN_12064 [Caenorhabditis brenneri]